MVELSANSGDPDQMPHSVASDLGLHCLPITLSWIDMPSGLSRQEMTICMNLKACFMEKIREVFQNDIC